MESLVIKTFLLARGNLHLYRNHIFNIVPFKMGKCFDFLGIKKFTQSTPIHFQLNEQL